MGFELSEDYVDVAERLLEFREKHPDGAMQQVNLQFIEFAGTSWVVYTAAAYRSPEDPCPGHGTAWEQVPGRTPYTKGSEVQNAETSAWGRAIVAALAADTKRGIASAQEVRNRRAEESFADAAPRKPAFEPGPEAEELMTSVNAAAHKVALKRVWDRIVEANSKLIITKPEADALHARVKQLGPTLPEDPEATQEDASGETTDETPAALEGDLIETGATE